MRAQPIVLDADVVSAEVARYTSELEEYCSLTLDREASSSDALGVERHDEVSESPIKTLSKWREVVRHDALEIDCVAKGLQDADSKSALKWQLLGVTYEQ